MGRNVQWYELLESVHSSLDALKSEDISQICLCLKGDNGMFPPAMKALFEFGIESFNRNSPLTKVPVNRLFTEGFTEDQIWEQIEIQNDVVVRVSRSQLKEVLPSYVGISHNGEISTALGREPQFFSSGIEHNINDDSSDVLLSDKLANESPIQDEESFFNEADMETFADGLDIEENNENDSSDIEEALWQPVSEQEVDTFSNEEEEITFSDFFDPPSNSVEQTSELKNDPNSQFEIQQEKILNKIRQLEEENVGSKEWDMIGEVDSRSRPKDSLLKKHLDFEISDKIQPEVTEEVNVELEELIKQRVADCSWDDVVRKVEETTKEFKIRKTVETEKSNMGLGELYEKEYMEKSTGIVEAEEDLKSEHLVIAKLFSELCYKLDSLTNFQFTPPPPSISLREKINVGALSLEEAQPILSSRSSLLAPEEVYTSSKGAAIGESEKHQQERKAARRKRKAAYKKAHSHDVHSKKERENISKKSKQPSSESKNSDLTNYSNSAEVFAKFQSMQ